MHVGGLAVAYERIWVVSVLRDGSKMLSDERMLFRYLGEERSDGLTESMYEDGENLVDGQHAVINIEMI